MEGKGPAMLDVVTYRVYRPFSVRQLHVPDARRRSKPGRPHDPIVAFKTKLILGGVAGEAEFAAIQRGNHATA